MDQCLECGGKKGKHAMFCSMVNPKEIQSDSMIFAYIDGSTAARMGKPRTPPASLTEEALWCWTLGWDKDAARDKG